MALPAFMYRDPAEVVDMLQRKELGCRLCIKAGVTMYGVVCGEDRNIAQRGVPHIGERCRWFDERGVE